MAQNNTAVSQSGSASCYIAPGVPGIPISKTYTCAPHFYCPNTTQSDPQSIPQVCPPTPECLVFRLFGRACKPQGDYEPIVCPPKFYCPDFKTMLQCPKDHFCPTGTVEPRECRTMSYCPVGAQYQVYWGPILICLFIDIFIIVGFGILKLRRYLSLRAMAKASSRVVPSPSETAADTAKPVEGMSVIQMEDIKDIESGDPKNGTDMYLKQLLAGYQLAFKTSENQTTLPGLDLSFDQLSYTLSSGQTILSGVTGHVKAGRVTAILGPSGAGKTTFMNVLMGKVKRTKGSLLINGEEVELHVFKKVIGYVPQEDIMLREMTVRETINHAAKMSVPRYWTSKQIQDYVDAVIGTLGLTSVQHSYIGDESIRGISGGQRKRVNIGIEMAGCPLAMFADEPTSGLDSSSALKVTDVLKQVARLGVTVVAVLHQPRFEIFEQFDDILLIVPGGRTAYLGPQSKVVKYFEHLGYEFGTHQNPADVLMDILTGSGAKHKLPFTSSELADMWQSNGKTFLDQAASVAHSPKSLTKGQRNKDIKSPVDPGSNAHDAEEESNAKKAIRLTHDDLRAITSERSTASIPYQTMLCHNRSIVQQYRRINSLLLEIGVSMLAGGLMGIASMGSNGELFRGVYIAPYTMISPSPTAWIVPLQGLLISMAVGLAGSPAGVKTFGEERVVFWREAASGRSRLAYYLGKIISVVYRFIITSFHFTSIFYVLARPIIAFETMFVIVLMLFYCVYGLASIVSMFTRRENSSLLAVVVSLFAATIGGFGPSIKDAEEEETRPYLNVYDIDLSQGAFNFSLGRTDFNILMMLVIGTVFRMATFALLCLLHRDKQK